LIEPTVAFTLFDKVLAGIGLLQEGKKRRSRDREFSIARLWHAASIPLREIDPEFAERCFIKGSYWMEPETWDRKRIAEKGIAIEAVFEETRKLLIR